MKYLIIPVPIVQDDDIHGHQIDIKATGAHCEQEDKLLIAMFDMLVNCGDVIIGDA